MKQSPEKKTQAIDALIGNIGKEGIFPENFMILLGISRAEAEQLMLELHEQKKLDLKWVPGPYYSK
jgi:hypothetical protein